ncbi:hypothetical protein [Chondromyces crocatus]|uniref:Uncharacterized protein n=1 Tax=Chondromyces crocatus TaxID=52 RepID=A0A0K1EB69_CHOCO|nr:hypothetical protein [Chondromyces crocatus]AKT37937.1 uncharacterized protein CMC5_020800 [Chondromyces crocatus]
MTESSTRMQMVRLLRSRRPVLLIGQSLFTHPPNELPSLRDRWLADNRSVAERAKEARNVGDATAIPESTQRVLELAWGAVLTSGFDSTTERALRIPSRRLVTQVATPEFSGGASDVSLRLIRLFGTVDREMVAEVPPADRKALLERRGTAQRMLGKLPEVVGPHGVLFVDYWSPKEDWLRPRDLAPHLAPVAEGQVHIFGLDAAARTELEQDDDFSGLLEDGRVKTYPETLESLVLHLLSDGEMPTEALAHVTPDVVTVPVLAERFPASAKTLASQEQLKSATFDALEWRDLEMGQMLFSEIDLSLPFPSEPQDRYQLFRELLARGPGRHNIRYVRELAFRRPAVDTLIGRCLDVAKGSAPQENLVLVRGQSGAGKSVVLSVAAVELRRMGFPVVYVPPTTLRLDVTRLETFARRIGSCSEAPVFVFFDGLLDEVEYRDYSETFAARLTKCVIIGTSYTFQTAVSHTIAKPKGRDRASRAVRTTYVDVNVALTPTESNALVRHLERFVPSVPDVVKTLASAGANHLFAALYRILPEARTPLREQFLKECAKGAAFLEKHVRELSQADAKAGNEKLLAQKLREALGAKLDELRSSTSTGTPAETAQMKAATDQLLNAVMLATYVGSLMPQTIALRILNSNLRLYRGAFTAGFLDEREVTPELYALSARSSTEAEIWVGRYLQEPASQMSILRQVANHLELRDLQNDNSPELDFLCAMLHALGPQGRRDTRQPTQYDEMARLVSELRKKGNVSPRLSLIEANAVREWIHVGQRGLQPQTAGAELDGVMSRLQDAEFGLRKTFDSLREREGHRPKAGARRLLATLETERACVLGTMLGSLVRCLPKPEHAKQGIQTQAGQLIRAASEAWRKALALSDDNVASVDAACWILGERFQLGFPSEEGRLECLAEWSEMVDRYAALDLTESQDQRRDDRSAAFAEALGNQAEFAQLVARLRAKGSTAADLLLARGMLAQDDAAAACKHLEKHCEDKLTTDPRVATFYLRAWWKAQTGHPRFFPHQRLTPSFGSAGWARLERLVSARLAFEPDSGMLRFLRAAALLHLRRIPESVDLLRDLDREALGGSRRSKALFLHADEAGKPIPYTAVYQGKRTSSALLVWCDALRQNITFIPQEHGRQEPRVGSSVGPFHLAMTFRGLYADPLSRVNDR